VTATAMNEPKDNGAVLKATESWNEWDRFLELDLQTGFMQTSWWADFRAEVGYEHFAVILRHNGVIIGGAVVMKYSYAPGQCFYYVPDGPVLPDDPDEGEQVYQTIMAEIDRHRKADGDNISHLRIEPQWQSQPGFVRGFRPLPVLGDRFMEPRNTLYVDLRPSEDQILAQMKPKGRYNIRLAQRHSVSVAEDLSEQGLTDFLDIYCETAERQGLTPKPADYFQSLLAIFSARENGSLFFAEYQSKRLAAALVLYFGPRAIYFFGGSRTEHREVMAPYLLHFEIMRSARSRGHLWYDFWGIAPPDQPEHLWTDISVFKRKFGGVEVNLVPTLDYVYDPEAYRQYLQVEGKTSSPELRLESSAVC
jgi:peptidoglycan pentaglycine glycine transferase (the first glycine)